MNNIPFNETNIEHLLKNMKGNTADIVIPANFTTNVMDRIRAEEHSSIKTFDAIYKKFLIFGSVAAAAAILLALNFMLSYNTLTSEYAMLDIFNGNIF